MNINAAVSNIASTSEALNKYCNDPKNSSSYAAKLLQWTNIELMNMQDYQNDNHNDHHEDKHVEQEEHCCLGCMHCLGLSWRDFM